MLVEVGVALRAVAVILGHLRVRWVREANRLGVLGDGLLVLLAGKPLVAALLGAARLLGLGRARLGRGRISCRRRRRGRLLLLLLLPRLC